VGLDFVTLTDHNTVSQLDYIVYAQSQWPTFLFVPGCEWTSYYGHGNGIGATIWVDHKIGQPGVTIQNVIQQYHNQGAIFSINHMDIYEGRDTNIPNPCVGCTWDYLYPSDSLDAMEIGVEGSFDGYGRVFDPRAMDWWDHLCSLGYSPTAMGGSDDHHGGNDTAPSSPIGNPTTMVFAQDLSAASILNAVQNGRTVIKLWGPDDPMLDFRLNTSATLWNASQVVSSNAVISATVTASAWLGTGRVYQLRVIRNNAPVHIASVITDPFVLNFTIQPPIAGRDRWRAVLYDVKENIPRTITSHYFVSTP